MCVIRLYSKKQVQLITRLLSLRGGKLCLCSSNRVSVNSESVTKVTDGSYLSLLLCVLDLNAFL